MLSLSELKKINTKVTAIFFPKEEYSFEGIIRWVNDRGFRFEDFEETEKYYAISQPCKVEFGCYEYQKLAGSNIIVETGTRDKDANNRGADLLTNIP
jgi:hypothetical protein